MANISLDTPIYILLPPHVLLLDVAGPAEVFFFANRYQQARRFSLHFIAPEPSVMSAVGLPLVAQPLPDRLPDGAILLLPGMSGEEPEWSHPANQLLVSWLRSQAGHCACLVTICAGALLAARAGLLDGHLCTTHHSHCAQLAELAPRARVAENRLFVHDGRLWSSAGVTSGIDLALSLLEQLTTPQCAAQVARNLVVYLRRNGAEGQFSPWLACVTPRHLTRLFREQTGITLMTYLSELRLALVVEWLQHSDLSVECIAERAGFADGHQLRRVWRRLRSGTPMACRTQRG